MITPIEFQSKTFKTGLGYEKRDVENFLSALLADYETLYKENIELKDKINTLNDGINYYKSIEKTLNKALILAEHTAEDLKESAIKEARVIEEEAKAKAQFILVDAQSELNDVHQKTLNLIRQYELYKAQFKHLAAVQCELLESDTFQIHVANVDNFMNSTSGKESKPVDTISQEYRDNSLNLNDVINVNNNSNLDNNTKIDNNAKIDNNTKLDNNNDNKSFDELYAEASASLTDEHTPVDDFDFFDVNEED